MCTAEPQPGAGTAVSPGLLLRAASCAEGDGTVWAAFVVFPGKRAQRFLLIIVFPDPQ